MKPVGPSDTEEPSSDFSALATLGRTAPATPSSLPVPYLPCCRHRALERLRRLQTCVPAPSSLEPHAISVGTRIHVA